MFKKSGFSTFNAVASGVAFVALLLVSLAVWSAVMRPEVNTAVSATEMPSTALPPTVINEPPLSVDLPTATPVSNAPITEGTPTMFPSTALPLDLTVSVELYQYFDAYGVDGVFTLIPLSGAPETIVSNKREVELSGMAWERYTPASTFKILNALIGLESGVIPDADYELAWDGTVYGIPAWEQDHTLRTAMEVSAVWYYQELARQVGEEEMAAYVRAADYGNNDTASEIDLFWLDGQLQISAFEQVQFLRRLYLNQLPFRVAHQETVKGMLLLEETETYALYGKTGWGQTAEGEVGWFVGFVETADDVFFFATVIESDLPPANFGESRVAVTKALLQELGVVAEFPQN